MAFTPNLGGGGKSYFAGYLMGLVFGLMLLVWDCVAGMEQVSGETHLSHSIISWEGVGYEGMGSGYTTS